MPETFLVGFRVEGEARPAGSKSSFPMYDKYRNPIWRGDNACKNCHGATSSTRCPSCHDKSRIVIRVVDAGDSGEWRKLVKDAASIAMRKAGVRTINLTAIDYKDSAAIKFVARFQKTRPKSHFRTGKFSHILKDDSPRFPTDAPDTTKLFRAVEDACTGIVYKDDAAVVRQVVTKEYGKLDCCDIEIFLVT